MSKSAAKKSAKKSAAKLDSATSTRSLDHRLPKVGAENKRTYHDVDYRWKVINEHGNIRLMGGKLKAGGEEFISVSSAAKRLTGSETNGYAFFGLNGDKPKAPKAAKGGKGKGKGGKGKSTKAKPAAIAKGNGKSKGKASAPKGKHTGGGKGKTAVATPANVDNASPSTHEAPATV